MCLNAKGRSKVIIKILEDITFSKEIYWTFVKEFYILEEFSCSSHNQWQGKLYSE